MHLQLNTFLLLLPVLGASGASYLCYKCSYERLYNVNEPWNQKACMDNPASLGDSAHVTCNSTSYCTFQEMYDTNRKVVTSYFRNCGRSLGNKCFQDWDRVTCSGSCQSSFCNRNETGTHYQIHFG